MHGGKRLCFLYFHAVCVSGEGSLVTEQMQRLINTPFVKPHRPGMDNGWHSQNSVYVFKAYVGT